VHRHRRVARLDVTITSTATGLQVRLADDGVDRSSCHPDGPGAGLDTVRSFVAPGHGQVTVERGRGGTVTVARLRRPGPTPGAGRRLRVVPPAP
jgi:hypothetical protein